MFVQGNNKNQVPVVTNHDYRVYCIVQLPEASYGVVRSRAAMG
jgi:hypothetical protein